MSYQFIVGLNSSTKEQNEYLLDFIKQHRMAWWHWIDNFWLLIDYDEKFSTVEVRDQLNKTHPGIHTIVIRLKEASTNWAGFGPSSKERDMFEWLKNAWDKV